MIWRCDPVCIGINTDQTERCLLLDSVGHVTADYAKEFAETEFEKYRVIQDRLFQSDFDRLMNGDDLLELPEADS